MRTRNCADVPQELLPSSLLEPARLQDFRRRVLELALVLLVAVIVLKGYALWTAAKRNEKWWFIILLIVNTAGILELVYLYFVAGKRLKDLQKMKGAVTSSETIPPQT